ncbi:MAG: glycerol-3-phosphate acyltransferase, partial [Silicimonas sp.]|nr:glycerol-3-phosphate acyltransferase [Silicimonas sp.]
MTQTLELPLWLFVLIVLFAAVTASTHLLFPSVRWFFRRRAERIVAELNKRLQRPIQPFKLLRRQDMIQRVIYDPEVVRAVGDYADANDVREDVAFEKARDYAREIVPSFSATAYYSVAIRLARWTATKLFDVRLHTVDEAALRSIDPDATVVFVMNHRSNFDYVLVTYLAADQSALSYAVGEWARVWPLSRLIRSMGAYFIRRRSRGELYRRVLSSYVQKATEAGVTQAVFPEGGLSRDGAIGEPKLGILSYIVDGWRHDGRDVVFVPISLNYDRVVEDRVLVAAGRSGQRRFRATIPEGIRFTVRYIWRRMRRRVDRFGTAGVVFGQPVSLRKDFGDMSDDAIRRLGDVLFDKIRRGVPVLTVPLIFAALISREQPASLEEIVAEMRVLMDRMSAETVVFANEDPAPEQILQALSVLVLRHLVANDGDRY